MTFRAISTTRPTGSTFYAFPDNQSLADWTTYRRPLTENSAPNLGRYSGTVDDDISNLWWLFEGSAQPDTFESDEFFDVSLIGLSGVSQYTVAVPAVLQNAGYIAGTIDVYRGTTWQITITDIGSLVGLTNIWFTVKKRDTDTDANSIVQVALVGGLLRFNQAVATSSDGDLTIDEEATGDITITVEASVTVNASLVKDYYWDLKGTNGSIVRELAKAQTFNILSDITRKIA